MPCNWWRKVSRVSGVPRSKIQKPSEMSTLILSQGYSTTIIWWICDETISGYQDKRNSTFPSTTLKIACLVPSQSLCSYPHVSHFFNGENWVSIPHRRDHRFHLVRFWWLFRSTRHGVILPPSQGWLLPCYTTKYIYLYYQFISLYIYMLYYPFAWDYHHPKQGALDSNQTTPRQKRATDDRNCWCHRCAGGKKKKQVPFTKWKFP